MIDDYYYYFIIRSSRGINVGFVHAFIIFGALEVTLMMRTVMSIF